MAIDLQQRRTSGMEAALIAPGLGAAFCLVSHLTTLANDRDLDVRADGRALQNPVRP